MMDDSGVMSTGTGIHRNLLGITDAAQLHHAEADFVTLRLVELQCSPIPGGFDPAHLQQIHRHLYQDLYDWAGELRSAEDATLLQPLDSVLDRIRASDMLRGHAPEDWATSVAGYLGELAQLQPFPTDSGITLREFATELARKNQLGLEWERAFLAHQQEVQSVNLRRLLMLAMDNDPPSQRPSRGPRHHYPLEKLPLFGGPRP